GLASQHDRGGARRQRRAVRAQLAIARETGRKVIIHERDAWNDTIEILKDFPDVKGVFHCFSGSAEGAEYLLKRGFLISFTGVVTFKNARRAIEALKVIPIEKLMIETDSPYMAPVPYRGERNDPRKVIEVARKIAEVKEMTPEDVISKTYHNAVRFYGIEERK
ncbi:MAG: TatD family hydrolase, partial [Clostridia bacterium]|nr:TatD family hydrolase [Clostridia bacterium]